MQGFYYFCTIILTKTGYSDYNLLSMRRYFIIFSLLLSCLLFPVAGIAESQFVVVIDPGHGGGDIGTPKRKLRMNEKDIALKVALKLGELFEEKHPEIKVVYTRQTDVYPSLPDRTRIARQAKGNLFISIHVNAAADNGAHGPETYVFGITGLAGKSEAEQKRIRERTMQERENLDIDGKQIDFENAVDMETKILCQTQREKHNRYSQEVAHYVQDCIMSGLRRSSYRSNAHDRGVKRKNIFVLCYSPMPAILVELGYMTNPAEERFMNTTESHELYAQSILKGCEQYYRNWKYRQLKEDESNSPNNLPIEEVKQQAVEQTDQSGTKQLAESDITTKYIKDAIPQIEKKDCYRIQFLVSEKLLKKGDPQLLGISANLQYYKADNLYRYVTGEGATKSELRYDLQNVRKLFPDAFVVHFDAEGKRTN